MLYVQEAVVLVGLIIQGQYVVLAVPSHSPDNVRDPPVEHPEPGNVQVETVVSRIILSF